MTIIRGRPKQKATDRRVVRIDQALRDPNLLGSVIGDLASWQTWLAVLKATTALPMTSDELNSFANVSGNRAPPPRWVRELWAIAGRGCGKSRMAAAAASYIAACIDHSDRLDPGETGMILILSPTVEQSKVVFDYVRAFLQRSPVLADLVDGEPTQREIRLKGNIVIACHPANFRSVRGRTLIACVFDECAFWRDESSRNPDTEIYTAVMAALSRKKDRPGMLIAIGSPYRKLGLLYGKWRDYYGKDDPSILVVHGSTLSFNPLADTEVIAQAELSDPVAAASEWGAAFRADLQNFLSDADIDAAIDPDRPIELPPRAGVRYVCFTDPGGGRHDFWGVCILHKEKDKVVVDAVRGYKPPFDPAQITEEVSKLACDYGCRTVVSDAYAAQWVSSAFQRAHMTHKTSELTASELFLEGLPVFTRGLISIPNHPQLIRELRQLERRAHQSGRQSVAAPQGPGFFDDHACSLFGAINLAVGKYQGPLVMDDRQYAAMRAKMGPPRRPQTQHWRTRTSGMKAFF